MTDMAAIVAAVLGGCLMSLVLVGVNLFESAGGKPASVERESTWLAPWRQLIIAVAFVAIAVGIVETVVFGASTLIAMKWEVAAAATAVCAWSDVKERIVPNKVVLVTVLAAVVLGVVQIAADFDRWGVIATSMVGGCALGAGVFFVSRLVTRGGVGYGDVKLFGALGLLLGFQPLFNVLFYALIAAFLYAVFLLITRKGKISDRLPLGPFAFIGVVVSIGFGV